MRSLQASFVLLFFLLTSLQGLHASPGVILLEKKDSRLNIYQLVKYVEKEKTVYALVKRDKNGRFKWSVNGWEQKPGEPIAMGFLLTVSMKGSVISRWLIGKDDNGIRLGLFMRRNTVSVILNLNEISVSRGAVESFEEALVKQTDELRQLYYPKVCGVLAFLKVMNTDQQVTDGKEIMSLITRKEPNFMETCPKLGGGISQLDSVTNAEGKIKIKVNNYINIDNVRIDNASQFSIVQGENGNMRLVVERGIQVTQKILFTFKKPLNFIDIEAATGFLAFNYGNNKSKRVLIDNILKK